MVVANPGYQTHFARALLFLLAAGVLVGAFMVFTGFSFDVVPAAAAVTGLGFAVVALLLTDGMMVSKLRKFQADHGAESSFRGIIIILVIGVLIAAGFALTDNQLGVFPLAAAITALGVLVAVLFVVTAWLLWTLQEAGIIQVFPGEPEPRALVTVPVAEEGQHVLLIEGIGEAYASRLNAHGTITIPQLLRTDAKVLAKQANVTVALAEEWKAMGSLMEVKGIGAQYAEILVMADIFSVQALADADADTLLARIDKIEESRKVRVLGVDIKIGRVKNFIAAAKAHLA